MAEPDPIIWLQRERGARGPAPTYSRERIAEELGAGAMTLYRCLPTKEDLNAVDRETDPRRNTVERCFTSLKHFQGIATRYDNRHFLRGGDRPSVVPALGEICSKTGPRTSCAARALVSLAVSAWRPRRLYGRSSRCSGKWSPLRRGKRRGGSVRPPAPVVMRARWWSHRVSHHTRTHSDVPVVTAVPFGAETLAPPSAVTTGS